MIKGFRAIASLALGTILAAGTASAGDFDLSWYTIDGGGGMFSTGGAFELSGTIGQPDAGVVMTGGSFELTGGFWAGVSGGAVPCPGDFDGSGVIDFPDLVALLADYGCTSGCSADVDGDGDTDFSDLVALLGVYGTPCP